MSRPAHRLPPSERMPRDRLLAQYDFSPRHGWGTYPERGQRNGALVVWEERNHSGHSSLLQHLSDNSLVNLVQIGRELGME